MSWSTIPVSLFAVVALASATHASRVAGDTVAGTGERADTISISRQSFGLSHTGGPGELWGGGPDYKVQFTEHGFAFWAALGSTADHCPALSFQLESIRRGSDVLWEAGAQRVPVAEGNGVRRELAPGLVERYDVRLEGIEQNFVFERAPTGTGDLIVRGRIATEYPLPAIGDGLHGLRFVLPGLGGISYGDVRGVNASGATAAGSLHFDGQHLDLVLPAPFVEHATYPLTLDPLIGPQITVASGFNDFAPDAGFDATSSRYLIVWMRSFSANQRDIRGQLLSSAGAFIGGLIGIETALDRAADSPTVSNCNFSNRFLVAWRDIDISLTGPARLQSRAVAASDGSMSAFVTLASGGEILDPSSGGETTTVDDDVLVAYHEGLVGLRVKQVAVPASGDPFVVTTTTLSTSDNDSYPRISESGGTAGEYLVVWRRFTLVPPGTDDWDLVCAVVDRNGNIDVPATLITSAPDRFENYQDVDGDGERFLLVYRTILNGASDYDVACRTVELDGAAVSISGENVLALGVDDDESDPAVGFAGQEYLLAWSDQAPAPPGSDLAVVGLDPFTCDACESLHNVDTSATTDELWAEIATERSGGAAAGDGALLVWVSKDWPGDLGEVDAHLYLVAAGLSTDLGGGCGSGGKAYATCAITGNGGFVHRLRDAAPATTSFLILGFEEFGLSCGSCTLVPDPYSALVFATGTTGAAGNDSLSMAIPASGGLIGLTFLDQWAVVDASPACSSVGTDLSNAIRVQIQ